MKPVIGKDRSLPSFSSPAPAVTVTPKTPRSIMKKSKTENGSAVKRKSPRVSLIFYTFARVFCQQDGYPKFLQVFLKSNVYV